MKRRDFLRLLALTGAQSLIAFQDCAPLAGEAPSPEPVAQGSRLHTSGTEYRLPDWYAAHRVQGHTRMPLQYVDQDIFHRTAEAFQSMGARVFSRFLKCAGEGAWWPSRVGVIAPEARGRNLAKEIIDEAHAEGMRLIAYYRHLEDDYLAEEHPDWVCKHSNGQPASTPRGKRMCFNSPYPDFFESRALELVRMGIDGFIFDEDHMPPQGCWCRFCRDRFVEEFGLRHPKEPDFEDPTYQRLLELNNLTIERTFLRWRSALHGANPDIVMVISAFRWLTMADHHLTHRLFRISDSVKTELNLPTANPEHMAFRRPDSIPQLDADVQMAIGYTMARDGADGRPARIGIHGRQTEDSIQMATAGVITHGCIANIVVRENVLSDPLYERPFALEKRVRPYLESAIPWRWAAVHFPESARNRYMGRVAAAWEEAIFPFYEACRSLVRARVPFGVITDSQLADGVTAGYGVLLLPVPASELSTELQRGVDGLRAAGGIVIERSADWISAVRREIDAAPARVCGGPERMHAGYFYDPIGRRRLVAIANDFSWTRTGAASFAQARRGEIPPMPDRATGVQVVLRGGSVPIRAIEAVTGRRLEIRTEGNFGQISVPAVKYLALVVFDDAWPNGGVD